MFSGHQIATYINWHNSRRWTIWSS